MNLIFLPLLLLLAMTGVLTMFHARLESQISFTNNAHRPANSVVPIKTIPGQFHVQTKVARYNRGNVAMDAGRNKNRFAPLQAFPKVSAGAFGQMDWGESEDETDIWRDEELMEAELGRRLEEKMKEVPENEEMRATVHIKDGKDVLKRTLADMDAKNVAVVARLVFAFGYRQPGRDVKESVQRDADKAAKEAEKNGAHQGQAVHGAEHFKDWKVPGKVEIHDKEDYLKWAVILLKAMHEADRVATFQLSLFHVQYILKQKGDDVGRLLENIGLYELQASLWGILNLRMGDKDKVEKKTRAVEKKILSGYNFAGRLMDDFNIKYSDSNVLFDGKTLDKHAQGIFNHLQKSMKMVDDTKEIVEKCESFIWDEPKIRPNLSDLKHTGMSQEDATSIQEDLKKVEEKSKEKQKKQEEDPA